MARTRTGAPTLSAGQAAYIVDRLIADRRISAQDVTRYVAEMQREIADLESRLTSLRAAQGRAGAQPTRAAAPPQRAAAKASPARTASRQLQGKYISLVRQIPKAQRGKYQKIAKEQGREVAIKALQAALSQKK